MIYVAILGFSVAFLAAAAGMLVGLSGDMLVGSGLILTGIACSVMTAYRLVRA